MFFGACRGLGYACGMKMRGDSCNTVSPCRFGRGWLDSGCQNGFGGEKHLQLFCFQPRLFFGDSHAVENQFLVVDEPSSDLGDGLLEVGVNGVAEK